MRFHYLVAVLGLVFPVQGHGAPPKKPRPTMPLPIGAEAEVILVGDETKWAPQLLKAKVVDPGFIVLLKGDSEYRDRYEAGDAYVDLHLAVQAGDPDGVDVILRKRWAVRVPLRTKVRVTEAVSVGNVPWPPAVTDQIPVDRLGVRTVRIIEGPSKGILVEIPTRNLGAIGEDTPIEQAKPETKKADPAKRAATLLGMAKSLEKLKKTPAALKAYQEIVSDYPATPAAKEAAERAELLKKPK